MVYNNADVFGLPWELVAKLYRNEIGNKTFDSISEWNSSFANFLSNPKFLDEKSKGSELVTIAYSLALTIRDVSLGCRGHERSKKIEEQMNALLLEIEQADNLNDYNAPSKNVFLKEYGELCKDVIREVFHPSSVAIRFVNRFPEIVRQFTQSALMTEYMSGFVVCGYGNQELFPSLAVNHIDGAPYGQPRIQLDEIKSIDRTPNNNALIYAFARFDTAELFVEEVSKNVKKFFY